MHQEMVRAEGGQGRRKGWEKKGVGNQAERRTYDSDMGVSWDFMKHMKDRHAFQAFRVFSTAVQ